MIRLIIIVIAIFLIWVFFFSGFEKRRNILVSVVAVLICAAGMGWESYSKKPRSNLVNATQLVSCGVQAEHSYRSNYDLQICLNNTASEGRIKRIDMTISAQQCDAGNCAVIEQVARSLSVDIAPQASSTLRENLSFKQVDKDTAGLQWSIEVLAVKAI